MQIQISNNFTALEDNNTAAFSKILHLRNVIFKKYVTVIVFWID